MSIIFDYEFFLQNIVLVLILIYYRYSKDLKLSTKVTEKMVGYKNVIFFYQKICFFLWEKIRLSYDHQKVKTMHGDYLP